MLNSPRTGGRESVLDPKFKLRIKAVSRYLAEKNHDIIPTINEGISEFTGQNGYSRSYVIGRSAFHEIGHIAGCATSKSIADELRALIFELTYNAGRYSSKNRGDIPFFSKAENKQTRTTRAIKNQYMHYFLRRQTAAIGHNYEQVVIAFLKTYLHSLIPFNKKHQQQAIDELWDYRISLADRDLSPKETKQLIARAHLQNEFFLAITGGRPLYALSTHELLNLPIVFLGVTFNKNAKTVSDICAAIPDEDLISMTKDINAMDAALG